jgi:hypothetical protein
MISSPPSGSGFNSTALSAKWFFEENEGLLTNADAGAAKSNDIVNKDSFIVEYEVVIDLNSNKRVSEMVTTRKSSSLTHQHQPHHHISHLRGGGDVQTCRLRRLR